MALLRRQPWAWGVEWDRTAADMGFDRHKDVVYACLRRTFRNSSSCGDMSNMAMREREEMHFQPNNSHFQPTNGPLSLGNQK